MAGIEVNEDEIVDVMLIRTLTMDIARLTREQNINLNASDIAEEYTFDDIWSRERDKVISLEAFVEKGDLSRYQSHVNKLNFADGKKQLLLTMFEKKEEYISHNICSVAEDVALGVISRDRDVLGVEADKIIEGYTNILKEVDVHDRFRKWLIDRILEAAGSEEDRYKEHAALVQNLIEAGITAAISEYNSKVTEGENKHPLDECLPNKNEFLESYQEMINSLFGDDLKAIYEEDINRITAAMYDRVTEICTGLYTERGRTITGMTRILSVDDFWKNMKVREQDKSRQYLNSDYPIAEFIKDAGEDIIEYVKGKISKAPLHAKVKAERKKIDGIQCLKGVFLPKKKVKVFGNKILYEVAVEDAIMTLMMVISPQIYGAETKTAKELNKKLEKVSSHAVPLLYGCYQMNSSQSIVNEANEVVEEGGMDGFKAYVDYLAERGLKLHVCANYAKEYLDNNGLNDVPERDNEMNLVKATYSNVLDYCHGVFDSKNISDALTKGAKILPVFAGLTTSMNQLKKGIKATDANSGFFDEPSGASSVMGHTVNIGEAIAEVGDIFGGIGIVSAITGIVKLVKNIKNASSLYSEAKKHKKNVEAKLKTVDDYSEEKSKLSIQLIGLRLAVNNKLRQIIACGVEILKRVMGIVATILKWCGVTYLAGLSVSLIKGVIHVFQNLYYVGRAIYKKMKGIKGLQRRETASQFLNDVFLPNHEGDYAIELMLSMDLFNTREILKLIREASENEPTTVKEVRDLFTNLLAKGYWTGKFKNELKETLFQLLSSKPKPDLFVALFPGLGAGTGVAKLIAD